MAAGASRTELEHNCVAAVTSCLRSMQQVKLDLTLEKTSAIVSPSLNRVRRPIFRIGEQRISVKDVVCYLGLEIDNKLSWKAHIRKLRTTTVRAIQQLQPMRTGNWGIPLDLLRAWYLTVVEKRLLYGSAVWAPELNVNLWRHLSTTQRYFLLLVTKAYRTTSTDALLVLAGVPPIRLTAQHNARVTRFLRFQKEDDFFTTRTGHGRREFETPKVNTLHPATATPEQVRKGAFTIYTDGSKMDTATATAFVAFFHDAVIHQWSAKLSTGNTVFQAEMAAIQQAGVWLQKAHIKKAHIFTDSLSSLLALRNVEHTNQLVQETQVLLKSSGHTISWIRAHANVRGNEFADLLARKAGVSTSAQTLAIPLPWSLAKKTSTQHLVSTWQLGWNTTPKGRDLFCFVPRVVKKMPFLNRLLIIFFSGHGPFPAKLTSLGLIHSGQCICGMEGSRMHYLWECQLTAQWHLAKPSGDNLEVWMHRLANNRRAHAGIASLVKYLRENEENLRPPVPA